MAAIITSKFRFHNAEQFKESFSEAAPTNYYMFIGRQHEFATGTTGGTDAAPPTPADNRTSEALHWDDMLAAKKIDSTGVAHAIPRRDLDTSGATKYDMYKPDYTASKTAQSGATNLLDSTFYFVTSAYRVYKVLDNNNNTAFTGGTEPTSTAAAPFTIGGYTLKYMYTLSTSDVQNFLTPDFMPAPTAAESGNARPDGALDIIDITNDGLAGSWATTADRTITNIPVRGDGSGARCSVTIGGTDGSADGTVTAISVTTNGSGYTHGAVLAADIIEQHNIQFTGSGTNATLTFPSDVPTFEVIIGPDGGHGSNPAKELGGHFVLMDVKLTQTEGFDFTVVNDFRQIGVVRDPYSFGTTSKYTGSTARQTKAIKLASNSGTFLVDEKISQTIPAQTVSGITVSSNTLTVTTASAHQLTTGQTVDIDAGTFAGGQTTGHRGTHHITVTGATTFTYVVESTRAPTGSMSGTATYTTSVPEGTVVEYDASNNVLFYVQTSYDSQGTNATTKQNVPFGGNGTVTGGTSTATGVPNVSYSSALNNTTFAAGYATPEMQPDSGDVLYIENRKPISRASDQTEDVKLIVEF